MALFSGHLLLLSLMTSTSLFVTLVPTQGQNTDSCIEHSVTFLVLEGDATLANIEDDVRANLERIGIVVNLKLLPKDEFNDAMVSGDFHLAFSETWGPPYDPHSYAASWNSPDEAYYAALKGLTSPTQAELDNMIQLVLTQEDEVEI